MCSGRRNLGSASWATPAATPAELPRVTTSGTNYSILRHDYDEAAQIGRKRGTPESALDKALSQLITVPTGSAGKQDQLARRDRDNRNTLARLSERQHLRYCYSFIRIWPAFLRQDANSEDNKSSPKT